MIERMTSDPFPPDDPALTSLHAGALDDEALVSRYSMGDAKAFDTLIVRYQDRIFNFSLRFTANPSDAEDIVQETFLKAYRGIARFRGDAKFSTWLFQIAKNLCINKFHNTRRRMEHRQVSIFESEYDDDRPLLQLESEDASPQERVISAETQSQLEAAIGELDPHYRTALILRDVEDMDYAEIAKVLDVPVGTVKSRIHRARTELQKKLQPLLEEMA